MQRPGFFFACQSLFYNRKYCNPIEIRLNLGMTNNIFGEQEESC